MNDYIEREAALNALNNELIGAVGYQHRRNVARDVNLIESIPAADVAPVVHAAWKKVYATTPPTLFECTACGGRELYADGDMEYCPHCGARMDGDAHV